MENILIKLLEIGVFPLFLVVLGWLTGKYLTPWIHAKPNRLERAKEIAMIADRITDELVLSMPTAKWDDLLDKVIDKIISELEIPQEIAMREAVHQLRIRGRLV